MSVLKEAGTKTILQIIKGLDNILTPLNSKVEGIENGAQKNVQADWNATDGDALIKNKPDSLPANGGNATTVNRHTVEIDVPEDAVFTDTWRDVQDNLTSDSSEDSLSAKQGKLIGLETSVITNKLGAKNLLNCRNLKEQTSFGITFTPSFDANGNLEYINVNGTCDHTADYYIVGNWASRNTFINAGEYNISLGDSNKQTVMYAGYNTSIQSTNSNKTANFADGIAYIFLRVDSGKTLDNEKLYPMIVDGDILDKTYAPFAKTNLQLTSDIEQIKTISGTKITYSSTEPTSQNENDFWVQPY